MAIGGRSRVAMQCEFRIPKDLATEADEGRYLEDVRRALDSDTRWSSARVTVIRQADPAEGWHLDVWTIPLSGVTEDLARTCEGVDESVRAVEPGAALLACRRSER